MATHPIILSGGHGTRLWPASRPSRPKQFLPLIDARSMFQSTVQRMAIATDGCAPIVVAGPDHAAEILLQLAALSVDDATVLIEPVGRDSAPAMAAAAAWIVRDDPEAIGVMVASDHFLPDAHAFRAATARAVEVARGGAIVTFGITPTGPSDAYGYIRPGAPLGGGSEVRAVDAFAEKPHVALARDYVAQGYLWNSGNFVFRAQTLLDELDRFAPAVARAARAAVASAVRAGVLVRLGPEFEAAPKISIDYAVMERTARAAVAPLDLVWSDLGAWDAVLAASARDDQGNAVVGEAVLLGAHDCVIRAQPGQVVAALGLSNIGVIVESDAVLVCDLSLSQGVKQVVERLKELGRAEVEAPGSSTRVDSTARLAQASARLGSWLRASALPLWWALGADHVHGGFHELLDQHAVPVAAARRARVQTRQTYVFALAGSLGWRGPWGEAVAHGWRYLDARFARGDSMIRTLVAPDGAARDETPMLYDQAFVLLAGAWSARMGLAGDHEARATALLQALQAHRRGPHGGYREAVEPAWLSNPHMHLFEAARAWEAVSASPIWGALADEIATLALTRFIDPVIGALRETFADDWSPAPGEPGQIVEPGHQFEWAWLLAGWAQARGRPDAHAAALRLFAIGRDHGIDARRGVAVHALRDDFSLVDGRARLWAQTERLKAALRLSQGAAPAERVALIDEAAAAAAALERYLETPIQGLWRDVLTPDGTFIEQPAPASSLYHIACAIAELEAWVQAEAARDAVAGAH